MATFSQDFIKFEDDTFALVYTFTDTSISLTGYRGWWGCATTYGGSSILEKYTVWTDPALTPASGLTMGSPSSTQATVFFTQADFDASGGPLATDTTYYHELVVSQTQEDASIVVAVGTFQVDPSQFSAKLYRP